MTDLARAAWGPTDRAYRRSEVTAVIGFGESVWNRASADVLRWRVKTRSGFLVDIDGPVAVSDRPLIRVRALGVAVTEPVEVVGVVKTAGRVGFSYRTFPGHPVRGEEAFIVERSGEEVRLTVRSLTASSDVWAWRLAFPALRVAQRVARRRYLRALG